MAIVPNKYVFIKESNGNVTMETYKGRDLIGTASLNPAKDIRISESYPESIIIPFNTTGNHIDNKFVSIPWTKIDFVGSVPSNTAPADINEAVALLGQDFFFELGGGGGGSSARNGLDVVSGFIELGGDLIRDTEIDVDGNILKLKNGDIEFGTSPISPGVNTFAFSREISPNQKIFNGIDNGGGGRVSLTFIDYNTFEFCQIKIDPTTKEASLSWFDNIVSPTKVHSISCGSKGVGISGINNYADDTAAATGGVPINGVYRNGSVLQIRVS